MPVGIFAESTEVFSSAITLHATVAETHPDFQIYGCANVSYLRADTVAAGTDIITIGYKWDKDPSLNAGSYRGSVSVSVVSLD